MDRTEVSSQTSSRFLKFADDSKAHYVLRKEGLFPAPLSPSLPDFAGVIDRFRFLGIFVAKALQVREYIYIFIYICVCVCVCMFERDYACV